jgi:hypothetical protein
MRRELGAKNGEWAYVFHTKSLLKISIGSYMARLPLIGTLSTEVFAAFGWSLPLGGMAQTSPV